MFSLNNDFSSPQGETSVINTGSWTGPLGFWDWANSDARCHHYLVEINEKLIKAGWLRSYLLDSHQRKALTTYRKEMQSKPEAARGKKASGFDFTQHYLSSM
jgi:hypothetical protein